MGTTVATDTPLAEITLRKYEKPGTLSKRERARKVCLCLGLLQPGDSRDSMVDVLTTLLDACTKKKALLATDIEQEVIQRRKKQKLPLIGVAPSNIRRHIKRLKDLHLVEKVANKYRITEFDSLEEVFQTKIKPFIIADISSRISLYLRS